MRGTQGRTWRYVLFLVPAVAAVFGVHYLIRNNQTASPQPELADVIKPSQLKQDSVEKRSERRLASRKAADAAAVSARARPEVTEASRKIEAMLAGVTAGGLCSSIEYRGDAPVRTKISKADWAKVVGQFHAVKADLLQWLEKHRAELPEQTALAMANQIRKLKIQRPPALDEPDISWRGIGVFTSVAKNDDVIRIGGGFVKMVLQEPQRARFEMARLVAQTWAPCALHRINAAVVWGPLLKCLDVKDEGTCSAGTYSESGWAVSSAIAAVIAPPGCTVPAFESLEMAACLKEMPHVVWKEARL